MTKQKITKEELKEWEQRVNLVWKDEGNGFFSGRGFNILGNNLAYIKLPEDHPDVSKDYNDLNVNVNGGLTFGQFNIFGWDYGHYQNDMDIEKHIKNALKFFKERYK